MDGATLGRAVCGHHTALAPLPLCRAHESRGAAFRPQKVGQRWHRMRLQAAKDADDLQLVKREGASPCMSIDLHVPSGFHNVQRPIGDAFCTVDILVYPSCFLRWAWSSIYQQPHGLLTLGT